MNRERPDEAGARALVERVMDVSLEHADKTGGVDYLCQDGTVALEVTRFTDAEKLRGRAAARSSHGSSAASSHLRSGWVLMVPETQPKMKSLVQSVLPHLRLLEGVDETYFCSHQATIHIRRGRPLSGAYEVLQAGVKRAGALGDDPTPQKSHIHRVLLSLGSSGTVRGKDEALQGLDAELSARQDNLKKLHAKATEERHSFVWLDDAIPYEVARPLHRLAPDRIPGGEMVLSRPPQLDPIGTQLWVVSEESGLGWLGHREIWTYLAEDDKQNRGQIAFRSLLVVGAETLTP